jgi:hypothetical protein
MTEQPELYDGTGVAIPPDVPVHVIDGKPWLPADSILLLLLKAGVDQQLVGVIHTRLKAAARERFEHRRKPVLTAEDREWFTSYLAEGMHTAFRKAGRTAKAKQAHDWIELMDADEWGDIVSFVALSMLDGLKDRLEKRK